MHQATDELLEDEGERGSWLRSISNHRVGTFYGEIEGFAGVYASAKTLEPCRDLLQEVLEGWIILGLKLQHQLPVIDQIDLNSQAEVA